MRFLLLLILTITVSIQGFAQVATPSLDPSNGSILPSVTPWRYYSTGAIKYGNGALEREETDMTIEGDIAATGGIIALNLSGFGIEAHIENFETKLETPGGNFDIDEKQSRLSISYLLGDTYSIGIGQYSSSHNFEGGGEDTEDESVATMIGGNMRMAEVFFLGAGINSYTQTGYRLDASNDGDKAEIKWQEMVFGIGILTGDPGQFQLKAEYSIANSPEVIDKGDAQNLVNFHKKTDTSTACMEIKTGDFFVGYETQTQTAKKVEIDGYTVRDGNEEIITTNIIRAGYINNEGFMITVHSSTTFHTEKESDGDAEMQYNTLSVNIGYNF